MITLTTIPRIEQTSWWSMSWSHCRTLSLAMLTSSSHVLPTIITALTAVTDVI